MNAPFFRASAFALALVANAALGETTCKTPSPDCVAVGKVSLSASLGLGARENPLQGGSDIPLVAIPHLSYYGDRFFIEDLEAGFMLLETRSQTFNLIAAPGYDRVFFVRHDPQNVFVGGTVSGAPPGGVAPPPPPAPPEPLRITHKHTTYLAGPEWSYNGARLAAQLSALYEVTGRHDGYEVRGAIAVPFASLPELSVSAGFTWKSAEVVRYYYGVADRYEPGAAVNPFVKVGYTRPLTERITLRVFAHYEQLGNAIADSPIVADDHVVTAFAGIDFKFL